MKALQNFYKLR